MFYLVCVLAAVLPAQAATTKTSRAQAAREATAIAEFQSRVQAFARLHERLAVEAGDLDETKSQTEIAHRAASLATALRAARAGARQGDIFTPAAARVIRDLVRREARQRPRAVRQSRLEAEEEVPDFVPRVNMLYPTTFPLGTFPASLLRVLPALPHQLEYRIVTHHLILRDVEANVIVDVLPNAIRRR